MSSSKNMDNFSFQASEGHPLAVPWVNLRVPRPLNIQAIRSYRGQLLNPYTRERWLDVAVQVSSTQLTPDLVSRLDYETYSRMYALLKDYLLVAQQEITQGNAQLAEEAANEERLRKAEGRLAESEEGFNDKEREFRQEIAKIEEKRRKLKEKYEEG